MVHCSERGYDKEIYKSNIEDDRIDIVVINKGKTTYSR